MQLTFLSADVPLVKSLSLVQGELKKAPYPMVRDFTSHTVDVNTLSDIHAALTQAAAQGWCLLKGNLQHDIQSESRAGLTSPTESTRLLILDFDSFPSSEGLDAELTRLNLGTYDYILQPSASSILPGRTSELNAHVFMLLTSPVPPSIAKMWLMDRCLTCFPSGMTLTKAGAALHWPIDPSVMDNSKLIYIAPPTLSGDLATLSPPPITLIQRQERMVPAPKLSVDVGKTEEAKELMLNNLRKFAGYKPITQSQYKTTGTTPYLARPGRTIVTGKRVQRGFVYLNLNGGDSWAYWHPEDSNEFIYNFKGEPVYKTAELLPDYYAESNAQASQPEGVDPTRVRYFVCRDFRADRFYNGFYDPSTNDLTIARASVTSLPGFMKQHGQPVPDPVQDWTLVYDPSSLMRYDEKERLINLYKPSALRQGWKKQGTKEIPPTIKRVLEHAVGKGETLDHFINFIACIVQFNLKLFVAWVLHGGQGTGKGLTIQLLRLILGETNVFQTTMGPLLDQFNGFLETSQLVVVDEAQLSATKDVNFNAATLRSYITEKVIAIRHMFSAPYIVPNYANFVFCSNMPDPVSVPQDDRRYNVGDYQPKRLQITSDEVKQFYAEAIEFFDYLMCYKADVDRANTVLQTESRSQLQHLSRTAAGEMVQALLDGDFDDLWMNRPDKPYTPDEIAYDKLVVAMATGETKRNVLTRDELLIIFRYRVGDVPESPNRFTSYLKHNRMYTSRVRKGDTTYYGVHVDWKQPQEWFDELVRSMPTSIKTSKFASKAPLKINEASKS